MLLNRSHLTLRDWVAQEVTRFALTNVHIDASGEWLEATDGKALLRLPARTPETPDEAEFPETKAPGGPVTVGHLVPLAFLEKAFKLAPSKGISIVGHVKLGETATRIGGPDQGADGKNDGDSEPKIEYKLVASVTDLETTADLVARPGDGEFPDTERVIPKPEREKKTGKTRVVFLSPTILARLAKTAQALGVESIRLQVEGGAGPIRFDFEGGKGHGCIMPMGLGQEYGEKATDWPWLFKVTEPEVVKTISKTDDKPADDAPKAESEAPPAEPTPNPIPADKTPETAFHEAETGTESAPETETEPATPPDPAEAATSPLVERFREIKRIKDALKGVGIVTAKVKNQTGKPIVVTLGKTSKADEWVAKAHAALAGLALARVVQVEVA